MSDYKSVTQKWAEKFAKDFSLKILAEFQVGDLVSIDLIPGRHKIVRIDSYGDGFVVSDMDDGVERYVRKSDCQQLTQPITTSGFYGNSVGYNYIPIKWDISAPWPTPTILTKEHGIFPETPKAPQCECGSHKTYGTNCSPDMHSTWCKLYGKA